jgi:hypothetical protein
MTFDGFDPEREFYDLTSQEGLSNLVEDLQPLVGYELWEEFDNTENGEILRQAFGDKVSLSEAKNIFDRMRRTNRILSNEDREEVAEEVETPADDRPRGVDGYPLSEHEIFYSTQPAFAIRQRIKTDQAFARFARGQMTHEFKLAEDAEQKNIRDANETYVREMQAETRIHPALRKFAQAYTVTPASKLKPIAGFVTVGDERFDLQKFNELVAEASAAKLIF